MAIYAIGDVQGCFGSLKKLLQRIQFNRSKDRLWFTGDLVNRGPQSLETLRYIKGLGDAAVTVLGNHDLHLLAVAYNHRSHRKKDTLEAILDAPDKDELLDWLRHRPLLHYEKPYCLVHAGLAPQWNLKQAKDCALEVEAVLRNAKFTRFFAHMYGDTPERWSDQLKGWDRLRFITNCLTRMRYCQTNGSLDLTCKGPPGSQPARLLPWFEVPDRRSASLKIIFGHWSTLGFRADNGIYALDTGCLWGGRLTALRIDGNKAQPISLGCPRARRPTG